MNNLVEAMDKIWGKGAYENIKRFVFLKNYLSYLFVSGPVIASAICEPWTSRCSSWIEKKQRGTRDQITNIHWIIEKTREFQKNIYFCFIDYAKAFDCVDHNKLQKIIKEMGIPDHLTCLLRNLYGETTD